MYAPNIQQTEITTNELQRFEKNLEQQKHKDFIDDIHNPTVSNEIYYLPQLWVVRDSKLTPIRIVYDFSAKPKERAILNDCLYKGPYLVDKQTNTAQV